MSAQLRFLSGARIGQVELLRKAYSDLGRHPLSDVRFDPERDLDVSLRHASIVRDGDAFVIRDLDSTNGTFVNGQRLTGDRALRDGDVIGFGQHGPTVEFRMVGGEVATDEPSDAVRKSAERMSSPRAAYPAVAAPAQRARPASTTSRIAAEVARQTRQLRRTTKLLIALLAVALAAFAWVQGTGARAARELARLQVRADSLAREAQRLGTQFQTELTSVRDGLRQSQAEVGRLNRELAAARPSSDGAVVARLRAELDVAEARQRGLVGAAAVDYRAIAQRNQDAVALLVVQFSEREVSSGTAFAVDSQGTLVTNRHVLVGDDEPRRPQRIAVKFSGSRQWFPAHLVGVADSADVGIVRVDIPGGTPRVAGLSAEPHALARGDPVAIIGYPLGEDLPMERVGQGGVVADPTLTVGTVSKVLASVIQVDGYGAPGSSGSPIFDREGRVAGMLYGGVRESQGKIIYGVPAAAVLTYLHQLRQ